MERIEGTVAVVTGGASGIGLGIARAFAARGAHVVIADIEEDRASAAAAELQSGMTRAIAVACDVTDRASVESLAERAWQEFGHADIVVNNAGVIAPGALIDVAEADARWVLDVNVMGVIHGCAVFGRRFVDQGTPAHIVNTGSEHSFGMPHTNAAIYNASKHAILGLSDVLRHELPDHIGVSVLCPGIVHTDLSQARRNRHERYGGAAVPAGPRPLPGAEIGLGPDEVGARVAGAVERGEFFILTHPPVVELAQERWEEIRDAFARQAPRFEGDERLDTRAYLRRISRG